MAHRKDKRGLSFFTVKISDQQYADANEAAFALGISVGGLIRQLLDQLPHVDVAATERWSRYRNRMASDKVVVSLDKVETTAAQVERMKATMPSQLDTAAEIKRIYEQLQLEEIMKNEELSMTNIVKQRRAQEALSIVERAELEERAEKGDGAARAKLDEDDKRRAFKEL